MEKIHKKSIPGCPLISIITVCLNDGKYLEETIKSVINQTYSNIEYIIIDGGSTDNTIDIIKKYESKIDYWLSESDKGIYDAMNKGISLAKGKWINFMNAGDTFYQADTIEKVFVKKYNEIDFIYGDCEIIYNSEFSRVQKAGEIKNLWKGMVFSHQSSYIHSDYHKENKYSLNYNIAGDFEFFYNTLKKNKNFKYSNNIISIMDVNGLSDGNRFKSIRQMHQITNDNGFSLKYNVYYLYLYIDQFIRKVVKICLPESIINLIKAKGIH